MNRTGCCGRIDQRNRITRVAIDDLEIGRAASKGAAIGHDGVRLTGTQSSHGSDPNGIDAGRRQIAADGDIVIDSIADLRGIVAQINRQIGIVQRKVAVKAQCSRAIDAGRQGSARVQGDSARLLSSSLNHVSTGTDWVAAVSNGGTVVWAAAGLAVLMMGFVLTRVIGEI